MTPNAGLLATAILVSFLQLTPAHASSLCCQSAGSEQSGTQGAGAKDGGNFSLGLGYSYTLMDEYRQSSEKVSIRDIRERTDYTVIPTKMGMTKYTLSAGAKVHSDFWATVAVPYVRNTMSMSLSLGPGLGWEEVDMDPVEGLGDVALRGSWRLPPAEGYAGGSLRVGLGVKTPTGSYRKKGSSGRFIHAHMQPGSGSWDPLAFISYERAAEPFSLSASAAYQYATRNPEGYRFGSIATASAQGKYFPLRWLGVAGGLTYLHVGRASDRDGKYTNPDSLIDDTANTGGDSLWVSVGPEIVAWNKANLSLAYQFPAWERVNGIQLVSRYSIVAALSANF
jgi:hypothetical protein